MDQQNIDRLFREKLDDFEITPSPKAWNEVEKRIGKKKNYTFYWIAASISLLAISWVVWPVQKSDSVGIASYEIDHPTLMQSPEMRVPVAAELDEIDEPEVRATTIRKEPKIQLVATEKVEVIEKNNDDKLILDQVEKKTIVATVEPDMLPINEISETVDIIEPKISAVKITYIATNKDEINKKELKSDSTGVLKKFIAFTEKLDPGEMLADIKTAKDNLLSSGFKNKKDRTVMP